MSRGPHCPPSLTLEQLAAGEAIAAEVRAHVEGCAECGRQLAELKQVVAAFPQAHFVAALVRETQRRAAPSRRRWVGAAVAALAAALVVVVAWPSADDFRLKGSSAFGVFVRTPDGVVRRLVPGTVVHPGDAVRFELAPARASYVVVLGADAAGRITRYEPASGPAKKYPGGRVSLVDGSVELDGTLGGEKVIALFCPEPPVLEALERAAAESLRRAENDPHAMAGLSMACDERSMFLEKQLR